MTLEELLKQEEGFRPYAYTDHLGYWTIGYGRMIDKRLGGGISREEALYLLRNDIAKVHEQLDQLFPWWRGVNNARRLVLESMAFVLGIPKMLKFKKTLAAIREERWADAAAGLRSSLWYTQAPNRVERLANILETGVA